MQYKFQQNLGNVLYRVHRVKWQYYKVLRIVQKDHATIHFIYNISNPEAHK